MPPEFVVATQKIPLWERTCGSPQPARAARRRRPGARRDGTAARLGTRCRPTASCSARSTPRRGARADGGSRRAGARARTGRPRVNCREVPAERLFALDRLEESLEVALAEGRRAVALDH